MFGAPRTSPTDNAIAAIATHATNNTPATLPAAATKQYDFGRAQPPEACWSTVNGKEKKGSAATATTGGPTPTAQQPLVGVADKQQQQQKEQQRATPALKSPALKSPALDAAAKKVLEEAASTPLPADDDSEDEGGPLGVVGGTHAGGAKMMGSAEGRGRDGGPKHLFGAAGGVGDAGKQSGAPLVCG